MSYTWLPGNPDLILLQTLHLLFKNMFALPASLFLAFPTLHFQSHDSFNNSLPVLCPVCRRMGEPNFKNPRSETNDNRVMRGPTGSVNWFDPRITTNEQRTWAKPPLEANWFNPRPYDNSSVAWGTKPSLFVDPMTEFKMKK